MHSRTPFGNPDGSRSDIQEVVESFVSFGQHHLGIPADDLSVRCVVGAKGSGKTVYLRRLQAAATGNESVYSGPVQQDLPVTANVVKFCQCFSRRDLTEKWMQLWYAGILRSLASHLLHARRLSGHLTEEQREELLDYPTELVPRFRREVSIYSQVTDIINRRHTARAFSQYFDDPTWSELATAIGDILSGMPPIYFFIDSVDEEYANAPMFWLQCQKGLFYRAMRFLRDQHFGGRLHVIVCVRDHVLASVLSGEHQNRYRGEPHIISLEWDYGAAEYFLEEKISQLPIDCLMQPAEGRPGVAEWLGREEIENRGRGISEPLMQYLLRHTRLLPRDIVILGNRLCHEVRVARADGKDALDHRVIRRCVRESATSFGNEQLAICANHIASSGMPTDAARRGYDDIYTGDSEYSRGITEALIEVIQRIGKDRFSREELQAATEHAAERFGADSDALSVLWQNRMLGFVENTPDGPVEAFFSEASCDHFKLPRDRQEYCLHSTLVDRVDIEPVGAPVGRAEAMRSASRPVTLPRRKNRAPARRTGDDDAVPKQIGAYPVLGVLGKGGMGVVYRAKDLALARTVAIKVLPERVADDPEALARFQREAKLLASINHNDIATIHHYDKEGSRTYLVMEFVDGENLRQIIARGALPVPHATRIGQRIAGALQAAHDAGVIHRDLKPSNVMIARSDAVKVLDFGLAKAVRSLEPDATATMDATSSDVVLGTAGYMSPEQIRGGIVDGRADIWAFGCVLFECLTGRPAFPGSSREMRITATLRQEPQWDLLPRKTGRKTRRLLMQCLKKDAAQRPDHVETVANALSAGG